MGKKLGVTDIRKHIRKCIRYRKPYSFLGITEDADLTDEAMALFESSKCPGWYDWVNGNKNMRKLIEEEEDRVNMAPYEKLCRRCGFVPEKET